MIRFLLSGALASLLVLVPTSGAQSQATDSPGDCLRGLARGGWDLPAGDRLGHVRGVLVDRASRRFLLEARLNPRPIAGGAHTGILSGRLYRLTDDGVAPRPLAEVRGTYAVGGERRGRFEAVLATPADRAGDEHELLGRMEGRFRDPQATDRDPVGRFEAHWGSAAEPRRSPAHSFFGFQTFDRLPQPSTAGTAAGSAAAATTPPARRVASSSPAGGSLARSIAPGGPSPRPCAGSRRRAS